MHGVEVTQDLTNLEPEIGFTTTTFRPVMLKVERLGVKL
jgi:hypothetical protein